MLDAFHVSDQTGEICHMAGFPVTSPLTDNNFLVRRRFDKGFVTYNATGEPRELVFYAVDPNTAQLKESQRLDVSALNGVLQAYTRDLRFFYTVSDDLVTPGNCPETKQHFRSYEKTPDGFVQQGVIDMGDSDGCTFSHVSSVMALAANDSWMLLDHFTDGPEGDSAGDVYSIVTIDPNTGAAIQGQDFATTSSGDFRWATFFVRPDSRTIVELEAGDDDIPQRLHLWQVNDYGLVSEAPGSPAVMDIEKPSSYLLPAGPTDYIVGIDQMLSEWSVQPDGTLAKVGEVPDPTGTANGGIVAAPPSTSSGRVVLVPNGHGATQMDIVTFLHDHPPQVTKTPFEYLINQGNIILFRPQ
jgi:hypothetical protein